VQSRYNKNFNYKFVKLKPAMDNTRILRISKTSLSALLIAFLLPPMAAQAAGTLQKINESGTISIGFRESAPPFSYLSADRQAIGYSVDICVKITEAIKRELKRSNLTVKYVPVSSSSRISALTSQEIDLECGSTTNTAERRKQVDFTIPTFMAATRLLVREESGIKSIFDLSGKTVAATQGTSSEQFFKEQNEARSLRATMILGKDHASPFLLSRPARQTPSSWTT
jgi:glutamate/aspartate transport system substrate-binding protein